MEAYGKDYTTMMEIIYSDQPVNFTMPSLFLAGPTPRSKEVKSWRPEALDILKKLNFDGIVFVPERSNWDNVDFLQQVEWEWKALENCDVIAFWVPRNLETMPAFTTNVEFGRYVDSDNIIYGRPDGCPNNTYLDWLYEKVTGAKPHTSLDSLINEVVFIFENN